MRRIMVFLGLGALVAGAAAAQQSASFALSEHAFTAGGCPQDGSPLTSPGFHVGLCALGETAAAPELAGGGFALEGGFVAPYPPPGSVRNLRFLSEDQLAWDPEESAGSYNLYQGTLSSPFDPGYGACLGGGIPTANTVVGTDPAPGTGVFLIVTVRNRLNDEGTKGPDSAGSARPNPTPCP